MTAQWDDRIRRIYVCQAEEVEVLLCLFLEEGSRPRGLARIRWREGPVHLVEFPQEPLPRLEERMHHEASALCRELGVPLLSIDVPEGMETSTVLRWIQMQRERGSPLRELLH